ncbi:MAG: extracellular solute-binding protein [Propionicimonas sp.]
MSVARKLVHLALVATVLATAACSGGEGSSDVKLTLMATSGARPAVEDAIKAFEAAHEGVTIAPVFTDDAAMLSVLPQQLAGGNASDIFSTWPGTYSSVAAGELGKRGFLLDLSGEQWVSAIPETMQDFVGADGKTYFAPLVSLPIVAIYNETAMQAAGLNYPTTFGEVLEFCDAANTADVIPFALGAQTQSQNQMLPFLLTPTLVDRQDPTFLERRVAGEATFAESGWVDVFARVQEMNDRGCFRDPLATDIEAAKSQVATGDALAMFAHSITFRQVEELAAGGPTITAQAFPGTDNADDTRMAVALGSSFSINAETEHPDLAKEFIAYLMEPENVVKYADAAQQPPALPNDLYEPSAGTALALQFAADGKTFPVPDQLFPNPDIRTAWIVKTQEMLGGLVGPADVAKAMDDAWGD